MKPIKIGERIIVQGIMYAEARVKEVNWLAKEARWEIILDWGEYGMSKVYDTDEDNVWFRYQTNN